MRIMSKHTKNLLSVSGGKDSTAILLLAIEQVDCVFADTGNEHELVYEYLDYLEDKLGVTIQRVKASFERQIANKREYVDTKWREEGVDPDFIQAALEVLTPTGNPFLDMCIWKGRFPSTMAQFCTGELKVIPINEQVVIPLLKQYNKVRSWQGIRRAESKRRSKALKHEDLGFGIWAYRPIVDWNAQDVFDMHRNINCRKDELSQIYRRFPEVIERIKKWEESVSRASKQGSSTFYPCQAFDRGNLNVNYKTHGIEAAARWSMTERGGKQFDLFKANEPLPACSSNYGLCEVDNET